MTAGDAAAAAGMPVVPMAGVTTTGSGDVREGAAELNTTRDLLAAHQTSGTHPASAITSGTLDVARIPSMDGSKITSGVVPAAAAVAEPGGHYIVFSSGQWVSNADIVTVGQVYVPNMTPAVSGYAAMYRNGDGRLGTTPSSLKFKDPVGDYELPDGFMQLRQRIYTLKDDPKKTLRLGFYAEDVNEVDPLLVIHEDGEPVSLRYEFFVVPLHAALQQALARVEQLEADRTTDRARIDTLEARLSRLEADRA